MPMPGWWRHLNKRFFNPRAMKQNHKWALLTHVGRTSGTPFVTPIDALPVPGGFAIYLMYGRNTDWAKNVLASQAGSLEKDGEHFTIHGARVVSLDEIQLELPVEGGHPPAMLRVKELIRLDALPQ